jgi:hypothetical protein
MEPFGIPAVAVPGKSSGANPCETVILIHALPVKGPPRNAEDMKGAASAR